MVGGECGSIHILTRAPRNACADRTGRASSQPRQTAPSATLTSTPRSTPPSAAYVMFCLAVRRHPQTDPPPPRLQHDAPVRTVNMAPGVNCVMTTSWDKTVRVCGGALALAQPLHSQCTLIQTTTVPLPPNYAQLWDIRKKNAAMVIPMPERCYAADVKGSVGVVALADGFVRQWWWIVVSTHPSTPTILPPPRSPPQHTTPQASGHLESVTVWTVAAPGVQGQGPEDAAALHFHLQRDGWLRDRLR